MAEATDRDLTLFRRWYEQAGTPEIQYRGYYDPTAREYRLTLSQRNPAKADLADQPPLLIPVAAGLLVDGEPLDMGQGTTRILELTEPEQTFVFEGVTSAPVPSLLRGFSAPVRLGTEQSEQDLKTLMGGDDDDFVAWDAAQTLLARQIEALDKNAGDAAEIDNGLLQAAERVLTGSMDAAMKALTLSLPGEEYLADRAAQRGLVDMTDLHVRRQQMKAAMGRLLSTSWMDALSDNPAAMHYCLLYTSPSPRD